MDEDRLFEVEVADGFLTVYGTAFYVAEDEEEVAYRIDDVVTTWGGTPAIDLAREIKRVYGDILQSAAEAKLLG